MPPTDFNTKPSAWIKLVDLASSVWTGIVLLILLFIYCTVGSAVPYYTADYGWRPLRQAPWLELTEFEWFVWWPFNLLIAALCANITLVTFRRIPFTPLRHGVWMIHMGILILAGGSVYYFGTKIEGETPVIRRSIKIEVPGQNAVHLVALPGSAVVVPPYRFEVVDLNHAWPIISGTDKGKTAYAVIVNIQGNGQTFDRVLLDGFPQYTNDIIDGQRAKAALGRELVDESLALSLDYEPQDFYYLQHTWALYARESTDDGFGGEWSQRPVRNLPRYNDYVADKDDIALPHPSPVAEKNLAVNVPPREQNDPLYRAEVTILSYLRYAHLKETLDPNGSALNPGVEIEFPQHGGGGRSISLLAFDPAHNTDSDGFVRFVWLQSLDQLPVLTAVTPTRLQLRFRSGEDWAHVAPDLDNAETIGEQAPMITVENTAYSYRILKLNDLLPMDEGITGTVLEFSNGTRRFYRLVTEFGSVQELEILEKDGDTELQPVAPDSNFEVDYQAPSKPPAPLTLVASPGCTELTVIIAVNRENIRTETLSREHPVPLMPGMDLKLVQYAEHAKGLTARPEVVPPAARQRNADEAFAKVQVRVRVGDESVTRWLDYHPYVFDNANYSYAGRFFHQPTVLEIGGKNYELIFSRRRERLPHPVVLESFELATHVGGYTGGMGSIRDWISRVRFQTPGGYSDALTVRPNSPAQHGELSFFQASWDAPQSARGSGGMNYTGLGVGSRRGVRIQLLGCCISVAGMLHAFYVKPLLLRRRKQAAQGSPE